jgi:GntR family transcriptional regulator
MNLRLSPADGVPIYRQIVNQVRYLIASGRLNPGDELPPIRTLAEQLVINPNTVARAYLELEHAGMVTKRHGTGTYVSENGSPLKRSVRQQILATRADALVVEARHLNADVEEVVELVRQRFAQLQTNPSS